MRQLLELGLHDEVETFLAKALSLLIELVQARRGYIELRDPSAGRTESGFSMTRALDDDALAAGGFSRSVISETFATGETVVTASAQADPRFEHSGSVRMQRLEAVLCAPLTSSGVLGVIYLQDRTQPGSFTQEDVTRTEFIARHLGRVADRVLWRRRQRREVDPTLPFRRTLEIAGLIGSSPALAQVLQQVALVAPLHIGVLLTGDSGTGKTQLARSIHDSGPRAARPFIEINCAALPEDLLENELFGALPGAHSTAQRRVIGKLETAEGGTLFLDEVAELPPRSQAKLLQLLQSGTYFQLGGTSPCRANVRIIAATNADLASAVSERRFREDLFYRLSVFPIRLPSLAERRGDIPALAAHYCRATCEANGLPALELSVGALSALEYLPWSGNVRELAHVVQAGVVRAHGERVLRVERRHLFPAETQAAVGLDHDGHDTFQQATRHFQEKLLRTTLVQHRWNVAAVARALDLTRAHVYNLLTTYRISRPGSDDAL